MQTELSEHEDDAADGRQPPRCLSLTVSGPWGHFRRVDGNTVKATYRVIPRTTVAGFLAAILGIERDGYYDLFGPDTSAIAIEPTSQLRTMNLPVNSLTTSKEGLKGVNTRGKVSVYYPDPTHDRQRTNYEVLVDPEYRIDVYLDEETRYGQLRQLLERGESKYTPSLGLSEYLAEVEYLGEHEVERVPADDPTGIDSAVPDPDRVVPEPGTPHATERSPGFMTRTDESGAFPGRRTTRYLTYAYSPSADRLQVSGVRPARIDGRAVVFR